MELIRDYLFCTADKQDKNSRKCPEQRAVGARGHGSKVQSLYRLIFIFPHVLNLFKAFFGFRTSEK